MNTAFRSLIVTKLIATLNVSALLVPSRRWKTGLATIGLILVFSPTYGSMVALQVKLFRFLKQSGLPLENLVLVGVFAGTLLMILLASIPAVYAALYQSQDLNLLLPMPFYPWQIVAAKLIPIYLIELFISWAVVLPSVILWYVHGFGLLYLIPLTALLLVSLPAVPLALASILCMLVGAVPGIGRNKWLWYTGITMALLAASLILTAGLTVVDTNAYQDVIELQMRQVSRFAALMPGVQFCLYALVCKDWTCLFHYASYLVVVAAYVGAALALGSRIYIGPVLAGEAAVGRKPRRVGQIRARSFFASAVRKELLCTLKDPAVAMNGLGGYIALPILIATYTIMRIQTKGKVDVIGQLDALLHSDALMRYLPFVVAGFGIGLAFFGSLSSLFSASYSKDGKRLWLERTLPVSSFSVFMAKLAASYLLVTPFNLATIAFLMLAVPFRPLEWVYVLVLSQVVIGWAGAAGLAVDAVRPKLQWKSTVEAVKQNVNVMIGLGVTMLGLGLNVLLLRYLYLNHSGGPVIYVSVLLVNCALLAGALATGRLASRRFERVIL